MKLLRKTMVLLAAGSALLATPVLANTDQIAAAVEADYDAYLGELFVHFHRNPELSFLESNTAARMAAELREVGLDVTEGVGGTGVVGMLKNGDGPLILLRLLPIVRSISRRR